MKRLAIYLPLIAALVCAGCAGGINTSQLSQGMSTQQVRSVMGNPVCVYRGKAGDASAQVWDYAKDTTGIPNPLDDYGWIFPPTTHVVRIWFVNNKLGSWQEGKFSSLESLEKMALSSKWHMPPNFKSPNAPQCIVEQWQKGGR